MVPLVLKILQQMFFVKNPFFKKKLNSTTEIVGKASKYLLNVTEWTNCKKVVEIFPSKC